VKFGSQSVNVKIRFKNRSRKPTEIVNSRYFYEPLKRLKRLERVYEGGKPQIQYYFYRED
jgi:hypothetical protein